MRKAVFALLVAVLVGGPPAVLAEDRGSVTNLPLPRFVSMKASKANVRRGPSRTHRIDWVFQRRNTPLEITAEYGHWRRVRDVDGAGGWIHYSLLSGARHVLIRGQMVTLRASPAPDGRAVASAEDGVIARLGKCREGWCKVSVDRHDGWVQKDEIWGISPTDTGS